MSSKLIVEKLNEDDPELVVVDLSKNTVYNMKSLFYTEEICNALKKNTQTEEIHLQSYSITDVGSKMFADVLRVNNHLRVLDLEYNKITNDGATALAEGLKDNHCLIELRLLDAYLINIQSTLAPWEFTSNHSTDTLYSLCSAALPHNVRGVMQLYIEPLRVPTSSQKQHIYR